jgi:hypothetical protein
VAPILRTLVSVFVVLSVLDDAVTVCVTTTRMVFGSPLPPQAVAVALNSKTAATLAERVRMVPPGCACRGGHHAYHGA